MAAKRGSFIWTDGPNIRERWSPRVALGVFSMFTLTAGSLLLLGTLGFLSFLWFAEGGSTGGANASPLWRSIMLGQYITPIVTISAAVLRIIQAAQALLITSLMAALLLEKYGVPMIYVAEVSILRSVNSGPWRLLPLFASSWTFLWQVKLPFLLSLVMLFTSLGTQFTSTLLVADLSVSTLVGNAETIPIGVALNLTKSRYDIIDVTNAVPKFPAFAELERPNFTSTTPNDRGLSDTGRIRRVFPGISEDRRANTRLFKGKAHAMTSRYVCARPVFENGTGLIFTDVNLDSGVPTLQGNISFPRTLQNAGLDFPDGCVNGSCYTSDASIVDCSIGFVPEGGEIAGGVVIVQACFPYRGNVLYSVLHDDASAPIRNYSQAVYIMKSNFTSKEIGGIRQNLSLESILPLPAGKPDGEFLTWELNEIYFSATVCFQQTSFDLVDVSLSADTDLLPAEAIFEGETELWNVDGPARQFGYSRDMVASGGNASSRGLYNIDSAGEMIEKSFTTRLQQGTLFMGNSQLQTHGLVAFFSPNAFGNLAWNVHQATQSLTLAALDNTGRPALALDTLMTTVARASIDNMLPFFKETEDAQVVPSVAVLAPRRIRGLLAVAALIVSSLLCVAVVAGLFLARTRHSIHGNYWHVAAQIFSEETQWILDDATEVSDQAVARMMSATTAGMDVKIGRSVTGSGRVQVVPYRRRGRGVLG